MQTADEIDVAGIYTIVRVAGQEIDITEALRRNNLILVDPADLWDALVHQNETAIRTLVLELKERATLIRV